VLPSFPYPHCFSSLSISREFSILFVCRQCVFVWICVSKHLFFRNKVDFSQVTSLVISRKRLYLKQASHLWSPDAHRRPVRPMHSPVCPNELRHPITFLHFLSLAEVCLAEVIPQSHFCTSFWLRNEWAVKLSLKIKQIFGSNVLFLWGL